MSDWRKLPEAQGQSAIRDLARAFVDNRVYHDGNVPQELLSMVFMPILFGASELFKGYRKRQLARLCIFAIRGDDHCLDRGVNGYPIFTECRIWRRSDVAEAAELAKRMHEALEKTA